MRDRIRACELPSTVSAHVAKSDDQKAFFNVMLRDFGVKEVRVQEVVSLDHEMLASLPYDQLSLFSLCSKVLRSQPVYGLVFLFKWRAEDPDKQEQTCPEGIWFANQVRRHEHLLPTAAKDP